jgi:ATP-dependent RNA helicase DeaD
MSRFQSLARNLSQSDEGLSLMVMLLDDYYQLSLHAPPEQPVVEVKEESPVKQAQAFQPVAQKRRPRPRRKQPRKE